MNKYLFGAFTLSCLLLNAAPQNAKSYKLDKIQTTGDITFKSDEVINHPGSKSIISKEQLTKGAIRSVDEALQRVPGVQIKDFSGIGVLPKVSVRGFGTQGNSHSNTGLILLDGISVYGAPYSNIELAAFPITLNMIDHIEITKGAASIWAGPNTFGGVINIISKDIPKEWESEVSEKITWWQRKKLLSFYRNAEPLGNNMLFDTYFRTGGYLSDNFGLQAQANVIQGQGFRFNTPQSVKNFGLDSIWNLNEMQTIKSHLQYYDYFSTSPGALAPSDYYSNPLENNHPYDHADGKATRLGISYILTHGANENGELNATYYYSDTYRNLSFDSNYNTQPFWTWHIANKTATYSSSSGWSEFTLRDNPRRFIVNGLNLTDSIDFDSLNLAQNINYGVRVLFENIYKEVFSTSFKNDILFSHKTRTAKGTTTVNNFMLAPFVSYLVSIKDTFSINPSIRYDYMNYNENSKNSLKMQNLNELSFGLNLEYKINSAVNFFINYNKSFLPQQYHNTNLDDINFTQRAHVGEFGMKYNGDDFFVTLDYFALYVGNQAVRVDDKQIPVGATLSHGLEGDVYYNPKLLEGLTLHLAYTFLDSRTFQDRAHILPFVSPHQTVFDVSYNFGKTTLAYSSYFYSSSFSDLKNTTIEDRTGKGGIVPAYYVANIQISGPLHEDGKRKITGSIGVNNLFDYQYYFRGDGTTGGIGRMSAPGRSVVAQVRYLF